MSSNLAQLLTRTAVAHGDRPALKLDDAVVTYAMLDDGAARVAGLLKAKGLEPGDRVGIMLPNVPYFALAYYGVLRAGGVVVPMNVLLKAREVNFYLSDSGARYLFTWHEFLADAEPGAHEAGAEVIAVRPGEFERLLAEAPAEPEDVPRDGSDTAVIPIRPARRAAQGRRAHALEHVRERRLRGHQAAAAHDHGVVLCTLPLFHRFGQTSVQNATSVNDGTLAFLPTFDPQAGSRAHGHARGHALRGGTDHVPRAAEPSRPRAARREVPAHVRLGGSALPVEVMNAFEGQVRCMVLEGYGLSETSPVASSIALDAAASQARSAFRSGRGVEGRRRRRRGGHAAR